MGADKFCNWTKCHAIKTTMTATSLPQKSPLLAAPFFSSAFLLCAIIRMGHSPNVMHRQLSFSPTSFSVHFSARDLRSTNSKACGSRATTSNGEGRRCKSAESSRMHKGILRPLRVAACRPMLPLCRLHLLLTDCLVVCDLDLTGRKWAASPPYCTGALLKLLNVMRTTVKSPPFFIVL